MASEKEATNSNLEMEFIPYGQMTQGVLNMTTKREVKTDMATNPLVFIKQNLTISFLDLSSLTQIIKM